MLRYHITSQNPVTHYFNVSIDIDKPDPDGQRLQLPNWIPGSYMIRDFSRHLIDIRASCEGRRLAIDQIDKSSWRVEPCSGELKIEYLVYARDLSVRGAHLDHTHGYYNGTSVFMEVVGQSQQPSEVLIDKPPVDIAVNWQLATTLRAIDIDADGFGVYQAEDYDDLIDHPVEMGAFMRLQFEACDVPHEVILTGRFECDTGRLLRDLKAICEHHIRFFGEPAPVDFYQFQVLVVGDGYGGLEHRSSTSLLASRNSLPQPGVSEMTDSYRDFLGLCSHEYFHTWNVKRIKPAVYQPYHLQFEVYTGLLWAFEGITSYYDDLALVRCGLIEPKAYLELLSQTITRVFRGKGATRQSAAESSFNAWTKFYKQDENSANAIVSYYAKGSLIALCIDLKMREMTHGQKCLDDVIRVLWQRWQVNGAGVEDNEIQDIICDLCSADLSGFLHNLIRNTEPMPLQELLATVAIVFNLRNAAGQNDKGGKPAEVPVAEAAFGATLKEENGCLRILRVDEGGSAQLAGLSAEDEIIAINGLRLTLEKFEQQMLRAKAGDDLVVHAFRRDELNQFDVRLQQAIANTVDLSIDDENKAKCLAWLQNS